jgi:excisionase family DNA binding protein
MAVKNIALKALDLMTTNDVAKELGVTIRSVQLWVEQGLLDCWKTPGGHRRITRDSFNRMTSGRAKPVKSTTDSVRIKVVVVEDDETMLNLYRYKIDSWNLPIDLKLMSNALEAIVYISQNLPDLLITDLMMPDIDGFSMLRTLRELDGFSQMAIIVVTGLQPHEILEKGGLPKAIRIYGKNPVPYWEMKELIQGLFDKKQTLYETR